MQHHNAVPDEEGGPSTQVSLLATFHPLFEDDSHYMIWQRLHDGMAWWQRGNDPRTE